jgi:hypothetical protein
MSGVRQLIAIYPASRNHEMLSKQAFSYHLRPHVKGKGLAKKDKHPL